MFQLRHFDPVNNKWALTINIIAPSLFHLNHFQWSAVCTLRVVGVSDHWAFTSHVLLRTLIVVYCVDNSFNWTLDWAASYSARQAAAGCTQLIASFTTNRNRNTMLKSQDVQQLLQFGQIINDLSWLSHTARNKTVYRPTRITTHNYCDQWPSASVILSVCLSVSPCWRVMETGHLSTRAVNSGRQLG